MSYPKSINDYAYEAHRNSRAHGFWNDGTKELRYGDETTEYLAMKLALIHSEVSEALEELRKEGALGQFGTELADIVIRVLDLSEYLGINIEQAIINKMQLNRNREYQHGKRF